MHQHLRPHYPSVSIRFIWGSLGSIENMIFYGQITQTDTHSGLLRLVYGCPIESEAHNDYGEDSRRSRGPEGEPTSSMGSEVCISLDRWCFLFGCAGEGDLGWGVDSGRIWRLGLDFFEINETAFRSI